MQILRQADSDQRNYDLTTLSALLSTPFFQNVFTVKMYCDKYFGLYMYLFWQRRQFFGIFSGQIPPDKHL